MDILERFNSIFFWANKFSTKCDGQLLQTATAFLLQTATQVITHWERYNYKVWWLTNWDSTTAIAFSLRWFTWAHYLESRKSRSCTGSSSSLNLKVCNIAQGRETTVCKAVRFTFFALTTIIWMRLAWRSLSPSSVRWRSGIFVPRWTPWLACLLKRMRWIQACS